MKRLRILTGVWLVALLVVAGTAFAQPSIVLPDGGIQFPDSSVLESAHHAYSHVVVVAREGAQFSSIQQAVQSIATGVDTPAADNRFLIWVAPGVYEEQVTMIPYVDIRGAGETLVTIRHGGGPTVIASTETALSHLSVVNDGGGGESVALKGVGVAGLRLGLSYVSLKVSGGTDCRGLWNEVSPSGVELDHVKIRVHDCATSYGIFTEGTLNVHFGEITGAGQVNGYGIWSQAPGIGATHSLIVGIGCERGVGITGEMGTGVFVTRSQVSGTTSGACGGDVAYGMTLSGSYAVLHGATVHAGDASTSAGLYLVNDTFAVSSVEAYTSHLGDPADVDQLSVKFGDTESSGRLFHCGLGGPVGGIAGVGVNVHCFGCYTWDDERRGVGLDSLCAPPLPR